MNKWYLLPCFLLAATGVEAQQLSLFTQYRENATIINPAAMESDFLATGSNLTFGLSYRSQWVGISGGPRTQTLRGSYVNTEFSGVTFLAGGHLINDRTGPTGFTGFYGRIGGIISGDPAYSGLAFALSGGAVQFRVDSDKVSLRDPGDAVGNMDQSQIFPDVGLGVYFYQTVGDGNMFYTGLSVPQVFGLDLTFQDENGDFFIQRVQHIYGTGGFYKFFDNDSYLETSLWMKYTSGAPINADLNLRYQTPSSIWLGAGVSTGSNFHLDAGLLLGANAGLDQVIKFGYGFDYSFSSFGPTAGSTHEINLSISFEH